MGQHAKPREPGRRPVGRREFLLGAGGVGMGVGLAFAGRLDFLFGGSAEAAVEAAHAVGGGPSAGSGGLVADAAGRLSLPNGFSYSVLAEAGVTDLEYGGKTPGLQDGSASFAGPGGSTVLVTNHEISPGRPAVPVPALPLLTYDPACPGGTTTVVLDTEGRRVGEYVSLAGTDQNCAGGITPWGTWLSCEETEARAGEGGRQFDHGYVFEVDPLDRTANLNPAPIKALGRFPHEAVVVDPDRGQLYLTEDADFPNGLLYRYSPPPGFVPGRGALRRLGPDDGRLAAMVAVDAAGDVVDDLSVARRPGTSYHIGWLTVPDRDAREQSVRQQFRWRASVDGMPVRGGGARVTRSRKLEGAWWGGRGLYFVSSYAKPTRDGSPGAHAGQVWFLDPAAETITLVLRYAPRRDAHNVADGPDNITVSPYGGVIIAEDGLGGQHLLGASPLGRTFYIARNERALPGGGYSEFTGPVFSPDGRTLYANLQRPGTVFAITGPWDALTRLRG